MVKRIALLLCLATKSGAFLPAPIHRQRHVSSTWRASSEPDEMPSDEEASGMTEVSVETPDEDVVFNEADSPDDVPSDVEDFLVSDVSSTKVEESLMALMQIAASTGRGEFATKAQKEMAEKLIAELEANNPTPEPANSPMVNGCWGLLYSNTQLFRSSPFFMAGRAVCSTSEQAKQYDWFCEMHRKALAISSIGAVRQVISPTRMISEFEVQVGAVPFLSDFTPFKYSGGWPVTIEGAIVSSADISPNPSGDAWEIYMDTVEIKGSNIPGLRQVLDQGLKLGSRTLGDFLEQNVNGYTNPRPVFQITYLSQSLRICRDQDGKVFVYGKVSDESTPRDYSSVDADLGLLKLLEGFNDAVTKFYI